MQKKMMLGIQIFLSLAGLILTGCGDLQSMQATDRPSPLLQLQEPADSSDPDALDLENPLGLVEVSYTAATEFSSVQGAWSGTSGSAPAVGANLAETNPGFPAGTKTRRLTAAGRHVYSKRSPFNADGSMVVAGNQFYSTETGDNLGYALGLGPQNEFNWSYTDPQVMFGVSSSARNTFIKRNIVTGTNTILRVFPQYDHLTMGDFEGVQTDDDCQVVLIGYFVGGAREHISYDICANRVDGTLAAEEKDNWSGFSHNGQFLVVEKNLYPDPDRYITIYDKNFNQLNRLFIKPEHGDFAVDCNGRQVYLMDTGNGNRYIDLATGNLIDVPAANGLGFGHVSGRNVNRPGYAYKSVNAASGGLVVQIKLCGSTSTVALAALPHTSSDEYNSFPMGAPSGDGRMILFASDYHNQTENAAYITTLP